MGSLQISIFFCPRSIKSCPSSNCQASANVITKQLDFLKEHHQLNQFCFPLKQYLDKKIVFHEFIRILGGKQTLLPLSEMKAVL